MINNFSNNNSSDSSIYLGKIIAENLSAKEKTNQFKTAAEEIEKRVATKRIELQNQALSHVDSLLSKKLNLEKDSNSDRVSGSKVHSNEEDNYFIIGINTLLEKLFRFFNFTDSELGVDIDPQIYRIIKEKEEKNHVATIIKLIHDKLKGLIKKVFSQDLSFNERLNKEMKELQKKLGSSELSPEEFVKVLDRLELLQNLKLKIQIFLVGWLTSSVAELLSGGIISPTETTEKEDKKTEETLPKEEVTKKAYEKVEIKVDGRKKLQFTHGIISVSSTGIWLKKPILLTKEEQKFLPKSLKITKPTTYKDDMNKNKSKVLKHDKQKTKQVEKKEELKLAMCSSKLIEEKFVAGGIAFDSKSQGISTGYNINFDEDIIETRATSINKYSTASSISSKESEFTSRYEMNDLADELKEKVAERSSQREKSTAVNNYQPTGEFRGVKVNNYVSLIKALEEASSKSR